MSSTHPRFENVSIEAKANIYFDGKVISHSVFDSHGKKFTLGLIFPGSYKFDTKAAERMSITSGTCQVVLADGAKHTYQGGDEFSVAANSFFTISVENGICEYVCFFE